MAGTDINALYAKIGHLEEELLKFKRKRGSARLRCVGLKGRISELRRNQWLDSQDDSCLDEVSNCSDISDVSSSGLEGTEDEEEEDSMDDDEFEGEEEDSRFWAAEEINTWMHYLDMDMSGRSYTDMVDILAQRWPIATRCIKTEDRWELAEVIYEEFNIDLSIQNVLEAYLVPLD